MSGNVLRVASIADLPAYHRDRIGAKLLPPAPAPAPAAVKQEKPKRRGEPEHVEQKQFIKQIRDLAEKDKRYARAVRRTFAVPNGGARGKAQAGKLKAEGVVSGVSDLIVLMPVGKHHGLVLEMKSLTGNPSREQAAWLHESFDLGYAAACCRGAREAMTVWLAYVDPSL